MAHLVCDVGPQSVSALRFQWFAKAASQFQSEATADNVLTGILQAGILQSGILQCGILQSPATDFGSANVLICPRRNIEDP